MRLSKQLPTTPLLGLPSTPSSGKTAITDEDDDDGDDDGDDDNDDEDDDDEDDDDNDDDKDDDDDDYDDTDPSTNKQRRPHCSPRASQQGRRLLEQCGKSIFILTIICGNSDISCTPSS